MPAPVENVPYMDAVTELKSAAKQATAVVAVVEPAAPDAKETGKKEMKPAVFTAKTAVPSYSDEEARYKYGHDAPVENIAYMEAVELKPTTQQMKAAAAATMKETASVESSKKTTTTVKPQILDSQANYFANKFI
ncbi:hypothetical protein BJ741DRAFT_661652 [Chytriomyces cf. hyalinus JEL632]|nr:hypothetical protein BJ741DRAFT_661652 [Chytriomyces cf. hyalinus JEL632]